MNRVHIFFLLLATATVFAACSTIKPLEYRGYSDFVIGNLSGSPSVQTNIQLYNPNKTGATLKATEIHVFVNEKELGDVFLTQKVKMKGGETFTLPITFSTTYPRLAAVAVSDLGGFLKGEQVPYSVEGYFTVQKFVFKKKYAFTFDDKLEKTNLKF